MKKLTLITIFFLCIGLQIVYAQAATVCLGGKATGINGSVNYSIGQMVYVTNNGSNGFVAQGIQQPYEISVIAGLENANFILLECTAYPNPTSDYLKLTINNCNIENLSYILYNTNGRQIAIRKINEYESTISLKGLIHGTYFLELSNSNSSIKTFKIIKQ